MESWQKFESWERFENWRCDKNDNDPETDDRYKGTLQGEDGFGYGQTAGRSGSEAIECLEMILLVGGMTMERWRLSQSNGGTAIER